MKKIRVVAGVILRQQKILVARRKSGKTLAGFWEFPGGKIEPNETPEQALVRELQEELDLEVTLHHALGQATYSYPFAEIELSVYFCSTIADPKQLESHDKFHWIRLEDLDHYQWAPADLFAVEFLKKKGIPPLP